MKGWNIFLGTKYLDTVYYMLSCTEEEIIEGLINHDGYPPGIKVYPAN